MSPRSVPHAVEGRIVTQVGLVANGEPVGNEIRGPCAKESRVSISWIQDGVGSQSREKER